MLVLGVPTGRAGALEQPTAADITGRDFAGVKFPQTVVEGPVSFAATQAWVWNEPRGQGSCRRLLLSGDVKVVLGEYRFEARRAVVWFDRLDVRDGRDVVQVFVYFEDVGGLGDPAGGVGFQGPRLPVRGVVHVSEKVNLTADLLREGRPGGGAVQGKSTFVEDGRDDARLVAEGERSLATILRRQAGLEAATEVVRLPRPRLRQDEWPGATPVGEVAGRGTKPAPATALPIPEAASGVGGRGAVAAEAPNARGSAPTPDELTRTIAAGPPQPIFAKDGLVGVGAGEVKIVSGESENAILASRGVTVQYSDLRTGRVLQLTAQRAVIFTEPGSLADMLRMRAESVRGMFLEGDVVATDGKNTLRGPQVYYDLKANRALMLDAVFWTYDERKQLPLYLRAKTIRQESADQFSAEHATFTNTAFFDPELAIGASSVTISRVQAEKRPTTIGGLLRGESGDEGVQSESAGGTAGAGGGVGAGGAGTETRTILTARNVTARSSGVPFFYWPYFSGDPDRQPVKDIRVENRSGSGAAVKTTLDAYALVGLERPKDDRADLFADVFLERGLAGGGRLGWKSDQSEGKLFAYGIYADHGKDVTKTGVKIDRDNDSRGIILGDERYKVNERWTLLLEGSYIGDAGVVDGFFDELGETRREFTNRVQARYLDANTIGWIEAKGTFNNFLANEYLLQSQGYAVNKTPELSYARQADDVLPGNPGVLTYTSEYRVGRLSTTFDEVQAANRGFTGASASQRAFGVDPGQSIADRLRSAGYFEDAVFRADTRHELVADLAAGPVNINPFVSGRVTAYDTGFDAFSPNEDDRTRVFGTAGVRASTQVNRVYDGIDSRLLDIHRVRHVIEPNAAVWIAGTNVDGTALPIYDDQVEGLTDGAVTKFGVTQTFQTQRGAPGRWHTSDFLVLTTDVVLSSTDTRRKSPIGRWIDYRPEFANAGKFFVGEAAWRVTDATSVISNATYDFDAHQLAASAVGLLVQHTPEFSTSAELRNLQAQDSTLTLLSAQYQLTNKYTIFAGGDYNLNEGEFQSTNLEIRRRFSSLILGVGISYNNITSESSFGFVIQPYGAGSGAGLSGAGGVTGPGGRLGGI